MRSQYGWTENPGLDNDGSVLDYTGETAVVELTL